MEIEFQKWKAEVIKLVHEAGFKNLPDEESMFISYDMENLSIEEAANDIIQANKDGNL